jgi:deazaflavin-dependent oxidoreductase (nitroreductase family)
MRKVAKTMLMMLGVVVVVQVTDAALHMWAWRTRNPRALQFVKRYNKWLLNRVYLRFSGQFAHVATVHHVGRRSGTPYATPVRAYQAHQDVIIPLPYGADIDWLRNLRAAGQGVVDLEGRSLRVGETAVVAIDDVVDLLPDSMIRIVRFNGAREALRLRVSEPTPASA